MYKFAKSSKPPGIFQWDVVVTRHDLGVGGQNDLKIFEMAIRHKKADDTNRIRESFL